MSNFNHLTPSAVGPVWPALLLCGAYLLAATGFIVAAKLRRRSRTLTLREHGFLHRLYDATEMVGAFALVCGLLGACAGLLETLPVLAAFWRAGGNTDSLQPALPLLRHALASLFAGLILGGLWRELLLFLLKPYTRPALMPLHDDPSADEPFPFEDPLPPAPRATPVEKAPKSAATGRATPGGTTSKRAAPPDSDDLDLADDWREMDAEGISRCLKIKCNHEPL
jgi:hypothetical protein